MSCAAAVTWCLHYFKYESGQIPLQGKRVQWKIRQKNRYINRWDVSSLRFLYSQQALHLYSRWWWCAACTQKKLKMYTTYCNRHNEFHLRFTIQTVWYKNCWLMLVVMNEGKCPSFGSARLSNHAWLAQIIYSVCIKSVKWTLVCGWLGKGRSHYHNKCIRYL